jgi:hypothetical protein
VTSHNRTGIDAPQDFEHFSRMSTLIEIEEAIEQLPPVKFHELRLWIERRSKASQVAASPLPTKPDFLARQRAIFGGRLLPDSQSALDEIRGDRF